ncbi:MAG: enoyl-CoA hydratase/isomerase family protein [Pirellulales bacterium]|nr:enoyl-CoA hydratase/isomerase family protein [Pirellulales bacterium]
MDAVLFEKRGHIALITLNRPEAHNAISPEVAVRLAEYWQIVHSDAEIRVAIVTGAGEGAFCSGADLARLIPLMTGARMPEDEWDEKVMSDPTTSMRALLRNFDPEKPVIAAINGSALAGGMEFVVATDIRVAADTAQFALREVVWSLFPIGGSTVRLPRQMPLAAAMEIMLTGNPITAHRAYELGFVNHVVPRDQVLAKALEIAETIAANGPLAVKAVRQSVKACLALDEEQGLARELEIGMPVFATRDAREGPRAFKEKRKPNFEGR